MVATSISNVSNYQLTTENILSKYYVLAWEFIYLFT